MTTSPTSSDIAFHLDQALASLEQGLQAQQRGQASAARGAYLRAAEALGKAAAASAEPFRTQRLKHADDLVRMAQALPVESRRVGTAAPPSPPAAAPVGVPQAGLPSNRPSPPSPGSAQTAEDASKAAQWMAAQRPDVRLKDVAGLEEVKQQIMTRMVYPFTHKELAEKFGIPRGGGVLLYGPPGTGKTLLARATAGELDAAFFAIKPSDVLGKWFGEAEGNIASLFNEARRYQRAVIFVDEVEGLVPQRNSTHSSVMPRIVSQFLQELEGFQAKSKDKALMFMGATNEPWLLDDAIMRPGRFDVKLYVPPPDYEGRLQVLQMNFKDKPLSPDVSLEDLARRTDGFSGADLRALTQMATMAAFREAIQGDADRTIGMAHLDAALERQRPSISPQVLARFERWKAEHGE